MKLYYLIVFIYITRDRVVAFRNNYLNLLRWYTYYCVKDNNKEISFFVSCWKMKSMELFLPITDNFIGRRRIKIFSLGENAGF